VTLKIKWPFYSVIIFICIFVAIYYSWNSKENINKYQDSKFLEDKIGAIYYSATVDHFQDGSFTVFIDENGETTTVKGDTVELGSIAKGKEHVFKSNHQEVELIGNPYKKFPFDTKVHTGYFQGSGYLKDIDIYFSIYNQGFSTNGKYVSLIRWGNEDGFYEKLIPGYYTSIGQDGRNIYLIEEEFGENRTYYFHTLHLKNSSSFTKEHVIPVSKDYSILSNIVIDGPFAYFMVYKIKENHPNVELALVKFDLNRKKLDNLISFGSFQIKMNEFEHAVPISFNNLFIKDHFLYHVSAQSMVYKFHLEKEKLEMFPLKSEIKPNMIYFSNYAIYTLEKNVDSNVYQVVAYSYEDGRVMKETEIKELEQQLQSKKVYEYDFIIFQEKEKSFFED